MTSESNEVPFEELAEEFIAQHRATGCTIEEFASQRAEYSDLIKREFEGILLMEMFRSPFKSTHAVPIQLGNYVLEEEIGRGGMGVVYSAYHPTLGNKIAVKLLPLTGPNQELFIERFKTEARIGADLDHPNIVPVFDFGDCNGYVYCTMQRIRGVNLKKFSQCWVHTGRSPLEDVDLNWERIAKIGIETAEALEYAHSKGVIHRDIKPSNLILDESGKVFVTDFGSAKLLDADTRLTMTGDVVGTVRYMPPEQLLGKYTKSSDTFGLGLTLSELVASVCGIDPDEKMDGQLGSVGPDLWKTNERVPKELARIIKKACEFQPEERYQSAGEFAFVLQRFLDGYRQADRRITRNTRRSPWVRKARVVIGVLALICLGFSANRTGSLLSSPQSEAAAESTDLKLLSPEERIEQLLKQNPSLVYVGESRKFFMLREGEYTWEQADKLSLDPTVNSLFDVPGQLATIRTKEENEAAWELAREYQTSVHLGASDKYRSGHWRWHHKGSPQDPFYQVIYSSVGIPTPGTKFINFASDRPNHYPPNQHWLSLRYEDGKWRDIGQDVKLGYLVEWSEADVISSEQSSSTDDN